MSQRLLISLKEKVDPEADDYYDAIYTEDGDLDTLLFDWCRLDLMSGFYCGPWKITIRDSCLIDKFMGDFVQIKVYIPELSSFDDVWGVYDEGGNKIHASKKEDAFYGDVIQKVIESVNER